MKQGSAVASMKDLFIKTISGVLLLFFLISILVSFNISSTTVQQAVTNISGEELFYLFSFENSYSEQALPETFKEPSLLNWAFTVATNIDTSDLRTLLGRELPGLAAFDGRIIVAGEGANFANLPFESSPPLQVLLEEREAASNEMEDNGDYVNYVYDNQNEITSIGEEEVNILIHHTHSWESFLPHLNVPNDNPNLASHNEVNITLVGERLGEELEKRGFNVVVDTRDMVAELHQRDMEVHQSYDLSREYVKEYLDETEFDFIFDLHRDAARRENSTVEINGRELARPFFVIGESHDNFERNQMHATKLHYMMEESFPGLSRGVFGYERTSGRNGIYNQDISEFSFLLEIGGVDNTLEESFKTAEIVAEIFANYYLELRKSEQLN
ncbi:stage II sporulation protein P [Evansella vedderi]|uniref:Stage II sporulation protein P n=1 Tax=Evansella vedderi TaxID=38282 RepID=A0ABT9ZU29_9BACI|nr:stage II sporulation protein P [Evansella vedderi]MDQ0254746.1 stage II sporulation protein P [Evansella vedderi]